MAKRVGIDLGTANVLVYVGGKGIVINEPSVVALSVRENRIEAVGKAAREMMGRSPESIAVIRPMREGVIADYTITEAMLRHFIGKVLGPWRFSKPEVMVCVPVGATGVEQRAVRDAAEQAGARKPAYLIPEPLAAAIGAKIPVSSPRGHMVLDIGGGRTEAAVISMYGIVASESIRVGGDKIDEAIISYIKRRHSLVIGEQMAEEVKIRIGSAVQPSEDTTMEVRGRDQVSGLPRATTVSAVDVHQGIFDCLISIVGAAKSVLMKTPPELASDVIDRGIVITGGGALLAGIEELISGETGVPCYVADDPMRCVAIGAGMALDNLDVIKRNLPTEEDVLITS